MPRWNTKRQSPKVFYWEHRCSSCQILLLSCEKAKSFCCGAAGKYASVAPPLKPLPPSFETFINDPQISAMSRQLNSTFSFASMETTASFPHADGGMLAIQGRVYHRVRPAHGSSPVRWMLIDGMHPNDVPNPDRADSLPAEWLDAVVLALRTFNPIARAFLSMHMASDAGIPNPVTLHVVMGDSSAAPEVAALISISNTSVSELCLRSAMAIEHNGTPQKVPIISRLWEPLAYPLFFPCGEAGWGVDNKQDQLLLSRSVETDHDVPTTQIWYYRRRLLGDERFEIFGKLASEYMVDMLCRNLDCRLNYIKDNLTRIQRDESALMGSDEPVPDGDNVYLPASFLGSIRWSQERTADALAVARAYGQPTFFITFTCNPHWPEISSRLHPGQTWQDAPLVVARVFKGHLTRFQTALKSAFPSAGKVEYFISRIEFQKRGLPHCHMLIRYENAPSICDVDAIVSAEMPLTTADAALVDQFMIHRHPASGPLKSYCDPKKTGKCRHGFPKPLAQETSIEHSGRFQYRRRNVGDEWVVPYSLPFLRAFQAHINFEVASSSHIFQYMFKYIHKRKSICI
jgi:hypothetical protein